ncbi:adenylate/guanylate cyclase with integral membrane sensor [Nostoc linckia NIES-25]|nr:adenylate/guanylate cyclase with integral membrane sensor [Nostoc linckia NIES-25]
MLVSPMADLHQRFQNLIQKSIPPEWENSLQNYYEKKFFPNISDKVSGEVSFSNYRPVSQAAKYIQYY